MDSLGNYRIEQISADALKQLVPLYKESFKKKYSVEYLLKKFNTRSFGAEYIGYVAICDGQIVACYVLFPCIMLYNGQRILAAQSGDTMTHLQHRNKGLFKCLAEKTFELAGNKGIKFIFGFPNQESYHGFMKSLSWTKQEHMNLYKIKITTLPIARICQKNDALSFLYKGYLRTLLAFYKNKFGSFNASTNQDDNISIPTDSVYMQYKTYGGNFIVNLNGTKAWIKVNNALLVGDIERTTDEISHNTIKALKRFALLAGCRHIIFSFSKGTFWDAELSKYATSEEGFPVAYLDLGSGLPLQKLALSFSAIDTF